MSITLVSPGGTQPLVQTAGCSPTNRSWKRPSVKTGRYPNGRHARPARDTISGRSPPPSPTAGQATYVRLSWIDASTSQGEGLDADRFRRGSRRLTDLPARSSGSQSRERLPGGRTDHDLAGVLEGGLDGSGHGLLAKLVGQFADLEFWVAAVAAEGLQEGQSAFLGPAGHGLG